MDFIFASFSNDSSFGLLRSLLPILSMFFITVFLFFAVLISEIVIERVEIVFFFAFEFLIEIEVFRVIF